MAYLNFAVSFHNFPAQKVADADALCKKLLDLARELHKDRMLEGDVEVELEESAGLEDAPSS